MATLRDRRRLPISAIAFVAIALLVTVASGRLDPAAAKPNKPGNNKPDKPNLPPGVASKPNIVVITTDDQTVAQLNESTMPTVMNQIVGQGTSFENTIATTPLCCPSRATMITGQYTHNHQVFNNRPGYASLVGKRNVLPAWLQRAGYVTAHVGKYLNRYGKGTDQKETDVGPGWDQWATALEPRGYFDYELQVNGRTKKFGNADGDYLTRQFNWRAVKMIKKYTPRQQPLYLQLDQFAPHERGAGDPAERCAGGAVPDPLDDGLFTDVALPQPPNYNEANVSDKPTSVQQRPEIGPEEQADIERRWRCALASLAAVDRGVADVIAALTETGELDNTVIMFWSDNGFFYGEHRIPSQKTFPYEEALRVPMIWRVPSQYLGGAEQVRTAGSLVGNIDIAPTILDLADAQPCLKNTCRVMDGRSLLPLMGGDASTFPADRTLVVEQGVCGYRGVRDLDEVYVQWLGPRIPNTDTCEPQLEIEHYNLANDPYELNNLYPATSNGSANAETRLFNGLEALRNCAGVEGRDPAPASGFYCE
jgi:N-acetylglucosamine-6-sulfatase